MRSVVVLRFVQELSLGEIAAVLDCPLGTVKSRLHTALQRLRADLRGANTVEPADAAARRETVASAASGAVPAPARFSRPTWRAGSRCRGCS